MQDIGLFTQVQIQLTLFERRIYYQDPALFKSQNVVDKYVDIFAYTFGVQRSDLNVVSFLLWLNLCIHADAVFHS